MARWADYLISQVTYDAKHRIVSAARHKDTGVQIQNAELVDREAILDDLRDGLSYCTIFSGLDTWKLGNRIRLNAVRGFHSIRIDDNKVRFDSLGMIPEVSAELEATKPELKDATEVSAAPKVEVTSKETVKPKSEKVWQAVPKGEEAVAKPKSEKVWQAVPKGEEAVAKPKAEPEMRSRKLPSTQEAAKPSKTSDKDRADGKTRSKAKRTRKREGREPARKRASRSSRTKTKADSGETTAKKR